MIFKKAPKQKSFSEQFPDYDIKPIAQPSILLGILMNVGALAIIGGLVGGILYALSMNNIPTPMMVAIPQAEAPMDEAAMFKTLSIPQLHKIGNVCRGTGDKDCLQTVANRILELDPKDSRAKTFLKSL